MLGRNSWCSVCPRVLGRRRITCGAGTRVIPEDDPVIQWADDSNRGSRYRRNVVWPVRVFSGTTLHRWIRGHPHLVDSIVAVLFAFEAIVVGIGFDDAEMSSEVTVPTETWHWLVLIGPTLVVPFRRLAPSTAVLASVPIQAIVWSVPLPNSFLAAGFMIYSAAAHGGRRGRWSSIAVAAMLTAYTGLGVLVGEAPPYALPLVGFFSAATAAIGIAAADRQAFTEAALDRARHAERSLSSDRARAVVEERARIARELHDVVAHGISVIVVQAAAAQRIIDRDPNGATTALEQIEKTGRNALNEMRHVLSAIRTEPSESWQPAPGLGALENLISELATTGLDVRLDVTNEPVDAPSGDTATQLPATVDMTAYRIVQESLTNVLKHGGPGARAFVDIVQRQQSLDLRIVDNGRGSDADDMGGHGLRGIQERVEIFGGRLVAGPQPGGGFSVSATLPFDRDRGVGSPRDSSRIEP